MTRQHPAKSRTPREGEQQHATMARLLARLADAASRGGEEARRIAGANTRVTAELIAADLVMSRGGEVAITSAGRAFLARAAARRSGGGVDRYLFQHLALAPQAVATAAGRATVAVDDAESPLAWLARRKGRDGRPLISPDQFLAGERLRADFTRARLMPRTTSNWSAPIAAHAAPAPGGGAAAMTDVVVAARQQVNRALSAAGPEFAGLLTDVCCFLKGLEDVERERGWPARSGKIVLQLGLDRLARHYGIAGEARGKARAPMRAWAADRGAREGSGPSA